MPSLILRFPAGRYHATPLGHHVNEGLIEWPPSPWRLLRALLSTGYTALGWEGDMSQPMQCSPPAEAHSLILKLAGSLPSYQLPPGIGSHTRHYMPLGVLHKGREKTTLVFDTWAKVGNGELAISWDVELTDAESAMLARLAQHLGYLGRSESWVEARLMQSAESLSAGSVCFPETVRANPGPGWEQIPLLAPVIAENYAAWRQQQVDALLNGLPPIPPPEKNKPTAKERNATKAREHERAQAEAPYPADLIACLQADTTEWRRYGWSQPPGSRRVFYWRRTASLESCAPKLRRSSHAARPVEAMLLSLSTASSNDHALPTITRTLPQAEMLHKHLCAALKRLGLGHSSVLSGCDEFGIPLKGRHEHAHILPLDLDSDGHLEHILIWAPMGLNADAQAAIRTVRQTFTKGGVAPLKLALEAASGLNDLRRLGGIYSEPLRTLLGPEEGATEWVSLTPFVPVRHLKPRGKNTLEGQIMAELASRDRPELLNMRRLDPWTTQSALVHLIETGGPISADEPRAVSTEWLRFRHFVRSRRWGPAAPSDDCFRIHLYLARPINGPLCLGYGSHFGLGMFQAAGNFPIVRKTEDIPRLSNKPADPGSE